MFLPFKIELSQIERILNSYSYDDYSEEYNDFICEINAKIESNFSTDKFIKKLNNDSIDGTRLQEEWFPVNEINKHFNVFISHSHKDEEDMHTISLFASWLFDRYRIKCFIDSIYWDYADNLTRELNLRYSNPRRIGPRINMNYNSCNYVRSCVDIMLANALNNMISNIDCILFVDSDNSISARRIVNGRALTMTRSPWIYHEINFINHAHRETPKYYKDYLRRRGLNGLLVSFCESLQMFFDAEIDDFYPMDCDKFDKLQGECKDALCSWFDLYDKEELERLSIAKYIIKG